MKDTIPHTNIKMAECASYFAVREKKSYCELLAETLPLFGGSSLTQADRKELIAVFSETKARNSHLTLSDKHAKSLIMCGLVKGYTPMSTRKKLKAIIPDFVLSPQDGVVVAQQKTGFLFWNITTKAENEYENTR